jgi:hypothetical protein
MARQEGEQAAGALSPPRLDLASRSLPGRHAPSRRAAAALERSSRRTVRMARRWSEHPGVQLAGRVGFLAKAALYGVVGALALRAALGLRGGGTIDVKEALSRVMAGRNGDAAVLVLSIGIAALGLWFALEGLANPNRTPTTAFQAVARVGQGIGGLGYVALGVVGVGVALGDPAGPSGDDLARGFVGRVLEQPTGPWAVSVIGIAMVVIGARQVRLGLSGECLRSLDLERTSAWFRRWAGVVGAVGFGAQGTLFALVGAFLVQAALEHDPHEATGTGGALQALAQSRYGSTLLLVAAFGLLANGLYAGIEGACKRLPRRCEP